MSGDRRPRPEDLLARAADEESRGRRGRLKVFFGASPGVGKTYAMLEAAQARRRRGDDVVVGWVETHGRADTEMLTGGLERVAPRVVQHRGITLREMDLDAVLARRPALVLVDELAHTNAPGSRHGQRWRDVEELLDAGVDVYSTLNVQHVESLRDVVAGITGVTVRETVPDSVLDRADEIELVDLSPDDLLRRLRDGKVYVPAQAERALEHFFAKGNLIALRELALRRTAERVDVLGAEWRRDQGLSQPWAARERVLVAVSPAPQSADLVRTAARMAARLKAPWIALSVETSAFDALPEADRARVASHLALAERLGAETLVVRGERVGDEILALARARDVSVNTVANQLRSVFARTGTSSRAELAALVSRRAALRAR
jgi:two-component system sensor histidine kinase KdpD